MSLEVRAESQFAAAANRLFPAALLSVAASQLALFTRPQADDAGISRRQLDALVRAGMVDPVGLHTFRLAGSAPSFEQNCMAAVLDAGGVAVVSGFAALRLWHAPGFPEIQEITLLALRGRQRSRTPLAVVTESRALVAEHSTVLNGIPVLVPTRLAFDIAYDVSEYKLEAVLNYFGRHRWTDGRRLEAMATQLRRRGRAGSAVMGKLLSERFGPDWRPADSGIEVRFEHVIEDGGFPRPIRQVDVGSVDAWVTRVDFKDPELPLLARIQSRTFHTAPLDVAKDEAQVEQLADTRFVIVDFWDDDVWYRPAFVRDRWREGRRRARSQSV